MYSKILSALSVGVVLASGSVLANQNATVAKIVSVKGSVLVENSAGQRQVAKPGMVLAEGSSVIVLEKGKADLEYVASQCNSSYQENTLLTIAAASQCPAGQSIAVGQAAAGSGGSKFGSMAGNTGGSAGSSKFGAMAGGGAGGGVIGGAAMAGWAVPLAVAAVGVGAVVSNNSGSSSVVTPLPASR